MGYVALWLHGRFDFLLSERPASLMQAYGELEPIARFFERSGFIINCISSAMEFMLRTFFPYWNPRMMKRQGLVVVAGGVPGDPELVFGFNGPLLVGVVFFPSSSLVGVMLFPSSVR